MNLGIVVILSRVLTTFEEETIVINIAQGKLRGTSDDGYDSYIGIPYASLNGTTGRFKRAGPAPAWTGVRDGYRERVSCYPDSDNCLQLNVHVPHGPTSSSWPVIVWVHGGPGQFNPVGLVKKGLILIMINYRVGPSGFLCLDNEKVPGNAGVKDVVLALRWVRDNIIAFRGDPSKVVVAGHSFGAAMVEALVLSAMSKGLFHGAIIQSGSVLCPWAFNYDAKQRAGMLATSLTHSTDEEDIINALFQAKSIDLMFKSKMLNVPYFSFAMCTENTYKKEERLLTESPITTLKAKKNQNVPMMIGYNSDEAYIFVSHIKRMKALRKLIKDVTFLLPEELNFLSEKELRQVAKHVKDAYFVDNITLSALMAYHRDAYFVSHIHRSVRLHATTGHAPIYYYQFSYSGEFGVEPEHGVKKNGAAHSDELAYLFAEGGKTLSGEEGMVQDRMLTLWSNFVKHFNPTPPSTSLVRWEPVQVTFSTNPRLFNIGVDVEMSDFPYQRTAQLWDDIYEKYYYKRHEN